MTGTVHTDYIFRRSNYSNFDALKLIMRTEALVGPIAALLKACLELVEGSRRIQVPFNYGHTNDKTLERRAE